VFDTGRTKAARLAAEREVLQGESSVRLADGRLAGGQPMKRAECRTEECAPQRL
jgi:hypothetical protein